jgi:hypothetical protein
LAQFIDSFFYAFYGKIQYGESGRLVIRFRLHQGFGAPGKWYNQGAFRTAGKFEPEPLAIEFPGPLNVVHRKTAKRLVSVEHGCTPRVLVFVISMRKQLSRFLNVGDQREQSDMSQNPYHRRNGSNDVAPSRPVGEASLIGEETRHYDK